MRRHWTTITVLLALLNSAAAVAQAPDNMVYNPSFEDYSRCPERIDALGVMTEVDAWWQPTKGSSDYFNAIVPFHATKWACKSHTTDWHIAVYIVHRRITANTCRHS